jgi:TetR/AcrR family transcriptional repressor of nem operon
MSRYEKGRKGETRRHIIEVASKRFRADGVDAVGVASLMADAGLTNGGFYAHFTSKEDLIKEAVVSALADMPGDPGRKIEDKATDLPSFIDRYLSRGHRDRPSAGCAVAALSPELTRRPPASRAAFQEKGMRIIERIASGLPDHVGDADRLPRALAVFSHLVGTLQMARFMMDTELSEAILLRGRLEARRIAGFNEMTTTQP